jgi:hypothetical protein
VPDAPFQQVQHPAPERLRLRRARQQRQQAHAPEREGARLLDAPGLRFGIEQAGLLAGELVLIALEDLVNGEHAGEAQRLDKLSNGQPQFAARLHGLKLLFVVAEIDDRRGHCRLLRLERANPVPGGEKLPKEQPRTSLAHAEACPLDIHVRHPEVG